MDSHKKAQKTQKNKLKIFFVNFVPFCGYSFLLLLNV